MPNVDLYNQLGASKQDDFKDSIVPLFDAMLQEAYTGDQLSIIARLRAQVAIALNDL